MNLNIFQNLTAKTNAVIAVDERAETVRFFLKDKKEKTFSCETERFKAHPFDDEFFETLENIVKIHFGKKGGKTALVLPDRLFFTDTLKLPLVNKRIMQNSISLAFNSIYKNHEQLKYNYFPVYRDRKNVVYSIVGIRKDILLKFITAVQAGGANVTDVTYCSSAMANGAFMINGKVKNDDCAVLDVKEGQTNLALVAKGKTVAHFTIPFGFSIFYNDKMLKEEELFDHTSAELLVLNAQELAKKKKLTTIEDFEESEESDGESGTIREEKKAGINLKKLRNLPKFMLREMPDDEKKVVYENFRFIVKWALEVIKNNFKADGFISIKRAFVNVPKQYAYLAGLANEEGGSGVDFFALGNESDKDLYLTNLELYGATALKKYNKQNNF